MSTFQERFKAAREASGLTQRELARRTGITSATISMWENDRINPAGIRAAALETAAGAMGVSARYLITGKKEAREDTPAGLLPAPPDVRNVPLVSLVSAGFDGEIVDPYARGEGSETVSIDADLARGLSRLTFALEISGDSMAEEFQPGDIVIIDPAVKPMPGDFVVAKINDERNATFKKYRARGADANGIEMFELVPLNEDYATVTISASNPGRIVGTMVEHRRRRRKRG